MNYNRIERMIEKTLPTIQDFIFLLVFGGVLLLGPRMMNVDGDLGRHLTIGEYILASGTIPEQDLFSHTMPGQPLTPHEWLSQVVFAALYRVGGLDMVVWGCAVVLAVTFAILFSICRQLSGSIAASALVVILGIFASSLHWLTRPHLFTILLLAVWLKLLVQIYHGQQRYWVFLPIVMVLWVNLHGAFIAGFLTLLVFAAGLFWDRWVIDRQPITGSLETARPWILGLFSSLLVIIVNPAGLHILETSLGYIQNRYLVGHTAEYLPPDFHDPSTWPFLIMLALLIFMFGAQGQRSRGPLLFITTAWAGMALYSTRNIPLFVVAGAPAMAAAGSAIFQFPFFSRLDRLERRISLIQERLVGWFLPVLLVVGSAIFLVLNPASLNQRNRFSEEVFPVAAVDWLQEQPQSGNMFNHFPWGGYLLYRLWPDVQVFIDGQTDFYGEALTRQYEQVITMQAGWEGIFETYDVSWVIIPAGSRLAESLGNDVDWELTYADETAVIFTKPAH